MATPTAVEILMAYLEHAYNGLLKRDEQVVSHPVDARFNFQKQIAKNHADDARVRALAESALELGPHWRLTGV